MSSATLKEYAKDMDQVMLEKLIEKEMPELNPMLFELQSSQDEIENRIKPAFEIMSSSSIKLPKNCRKYLEMKHNLLLSYCSFIVFYLLMKVEGS